MDGRIVTWLALWPAVAVVLGPLVGRWLRHRNSEMET